MGVSLFPASAGVYYAGSWAESLTNSNAAAAAIAATLGGVYHLCMPARLEFEQWLPVSSDKVFQFFADPRNLPLISRPENDLRVLGAGLVPRDGEPDLKVLLSFRPVPSLPFIRLRWTALITDFDTGRRFRDVQLAGPFKLWEHTHEFAPLARDGHQGTLIRDTINYEVGFSFLGPLANVVFVRRMLRKMFAYRQQATEDLLVSGPPTATED